MSTRFLTPISGNSERNTRPGAARSRLEPRGAVWSRLEPSGAAAHGPEQVLKLLGSRDLPSWKNIGPSPIVDMQENTDHAATGPEQVLKLLRDGDFLKNDCWGASDTGG